MYGYLCLYLHVFLAFISIDLSYSIFESLFCTTDYTVATIADEAVALLNARLCIDHPRPLSKAVFRKIWSSPISSVWVKSQFEPPRCINTECISRIDEFINELVKPCMLIHTGSNHSPLRVIMCVIKKLTAVRERLSLYRTRIEYKTTSPEQRII